MLAHAGRRIGFLRRRIRIQRPTEARQSICALERCSISLDALGAEESVCPVRAIDVGAVGNGRLGERACCDGWGAVIPTRRQILAFPLSPFFLPPLRQGM